MKFTVRDIHAKSILQKTGIPGIDWVVNPYTGCRFGCKYCYAFFVGRFRHPDEEWGSYVDAKINAPQLLKKEIEGKRGSIWFSSVTDPYQGLEAKYQLTRKCLQVLADVKYPGQVSILTKSYLITRDIDVLKRLSAAEVGVTVTSPGDPLTEYLETFAPPHKERIKALRQLHEEGIPTYAFVGPLLPHLVWQEKAMKGLFKSLREAGVGYIYLEHLNLRPYIRERLFNYLKSDHPGLVERFAQAQSPHYRQALDALLTKLVDEVGLTVAGGSPIHHPETGSWKKHS